MTESTCIGEAWQSEHHYPQPRIRQIAGWLLKIALAAMSILFIMQIGLAFRVGWLFGGTALFTAVLTLPLLIRAVLHPEVGVTEAGLWLQPMLGPRQFVAWSAIAGLVPHPLVYNDEAMGRVLHGKNYQRREGTVIVVKPEAGLWPVYRLIGGLAGVGSQPAFAISNTTHTDYAALVNAIRQRLASPETDPGA